VNGRLVSNRARESGKAFLEIPTSASGDNLRQMDTAYTSGKMVTDMKESGLTVSNTVKEPTFLQMETFILGSISLESLMALVNTSGKMEVTT
jgi:hypothetical protein